MTAPVVAVARMGGAMAVGAGLGLIYGFLRPLRPRLTIIADLLFLILTLIGWVYVSFAICQGDLGISTTAGMFLGMLLEEWTLGRLLRPVFYLIWQPARKIFNIFVYFTKKSICICEKMGYNIR